MIIFTEEFIPEYLADCCMETLFRMFTYFLPAIACFDFALTSEPIAVCLDMEAVCVSDVECSDLEDCSGALLDWSFEPTFNLKDTREHREVIWRRALSEHFDTSLPPLSKCPLQLQTAAGLSPTDAQHLPESNLHEPTRTYFSRYPEFKEAVAIMEKDFGRTESFRVSDGVSLSAKENDDLVQRLDRARRVMACYILAYGRGNGVYTQGFTWIFASLSSEEWMSDDELFMGFHILMTKIHPQQFMERNTDMSKLLVHRVLDYLGIDVDVFMGMSVSIVSVIGAQVDLQLSARLLDIAFAVGFEGLLAVYITLFEELFVEALAIRASGMEQDLFECVRIILTPPRVLSVFFSKNILARSKARLVSNEAKSIARMADPRFSSLEQREWAFRYAHLDMKAFVRKSVWAQAVDRAELGKDGFFSFDAVEARPFPEKLKAELAKYPLSDLGLSYFGKAGLAQAHGRIYATLARYSMRNYAAGFTPDVASLVAVLLASINGTDEEIFNLLAALMESVVPSVVACIRYLEFFSKNIPCPFPNKEHVMVCPMLSVYSNGGFPLDVSTLVMDVALTSGLPGLFSIYLASMEAMAPTTRGCGLSQVANFFTGAGPREKNKVLERRAAAIHGARWHFFEEFLGKETLGAVESVTTRGKVKISKFTTSSSQLIFQFQLDTCVESFSTPNLETVDLAKLGLLLENEFRYLPCQQGKSVLAFSTHAKPTLVARKVSVDFDGIATGFIACPFQADGQVYELHMRKPLAGFVEHADAVEACRTWLRESFLKIFFALSLSYAMSDLKAEGKGCTEDLGTYVQPKAKAIIPKFDPCLSPSESAGFLPFLPDPGPISASVYCTKTRVVLTCDFASSSVRTYRSSLRKEAMGLRIDCKKPFSSQTDSLISECQASHYSRHLILQVGAEREGELLRYSTRSGMEEDTDLVKWRFVKNRKNTIVRHKTSGDGVWVRTADCSVKVWREILSDPEAPFVYNPSELHGLEGDWACKQTASAVSEPATLASRIVDSCNNGSSYLRCVWHVRDSLVHIVKESPTCETGVRKLTKECRNLLNGYLAAI